MLVELLAYFSRGQKTHFCYNFGALLKKKDPITSTIVIKTFKGVG